MNDEPVAGPQARIEGETMIDSNRNTNASGPAGPPSQGDAGVSAASASVRATPPERWGLELAILPERNGPAVAQERVSERDLSDHHGELWFQGCVRRGFRDVPLDELAFEVVPIFQRSTGSCTSFLVESTAPDGERICLVFTNHSLEHVAERASARLVADGVLEAGDLYWYRIVPRRVRSPADARPPGDGDGGAAPLPAGRLKLKAKRSSLTFLSRPLAGLLAAAAPVDLDEHRFPYPVFYTAAAVEKAEALSRKGGQRSPPVETGALLLGPLCACPETQEVFAVVTDVLELLDAEQEKYSLTLSARTWQRIQTVVRARQSQPGMRHLRILGQAHGHNFLPGEPGVGSLAGVTDSAFVSKDDRIWNSAVFSGQPYQLCMIFGLDADGQRVQKLFGLEDGRLLERGYYVIPQFDPAGSSAEANPVCLPRTGEA